MFQFCLNGNTVSVEDASVHCTLLEYLRDHGFTGAKDGCAEGECGACTVVVVKDNGSGSEYHPVNSCLMLLPMAAGQEIYTVESLAGRNSLLHPVQESMVASAGSQCGYCTPGFVMSLFAEYYRPGREGPCDPEALTGNLCRCTGYRPIRDAALSLGPAADDHFAKRLAKLAPPLTTFEYSDGEAYFSRPASLTDCLRELNADPMARLIAGGTDLVVEANLRGTRLSRFISLEAVSELRTWEETQNYLQIGAALTFTEISRNWQTAPPFIHEWLTLFASPLIRNRATIGGNLVTASPIGDSAPLLLALDAQLRIAGPDGERIEPIESFFTGYRRTTLRPGELLVSIRIPKPLSSLARFYKVAKRKVDDISTVSACLAIILDGAGRVQKARFAYGGVAERPRRIYEAERAVEGQALTRNAVCRAQDAILRAISPISDHRGSDRYRAEMAKSLVEQFIYETVEKAA